MGKGNWRPYNDDSLYVLRYFDLIKRYEVEDDEDDFGYCFDFFKDDIENSLPNSFVTARKGSRISVPYSNFSRDNEILFYNDIVCIMIDATADLDHVGLAMVKLVNDSCYNLQSHLNFGDRYLSRSAPAFWKRLGGEQQIRTSAWTSKTVKE